MRYRLRAVLCPQFLGDGVADGTAFSRYHEGYSMARQQPSTGLHRLTVREILAAGEGDHTDGGSLLLRIRNESAAWVFRFTGPAASAARWGSGPHIGAARRRPATA